MKKKTGKIYPSYMDVGSMKKKKLVYTAIKTRKGKTMLKNFKTKKAAENFIKR